MRKCYDVYGAQKFASITEGVIDPTSYEFMVSYHSYTRYFPAYMRIHILSKKQKELEAIVADTMAKGCSSESVMAVARGQEAVDEQDAQSPEQKKRARKLKKTPSAKKLVETVDFVSRTGGVVMKTVLLFLRYICWM